MIGQNFGNRLIDGFTMYVVTAASLMLLLYVGYGDSKRTYEQIHIEKLAVYDQAGHQIFDATDNTNTVLPELPAGILKLKQEVQVEYGDAYYQVIIPLRTRFERGAQLLSHDLRLR